MSWSEAWRVRWVLWGATEHLQKANDKRRPFNSQFKPCSEDQKVATADLRESFVYCSHKLTLLNVKHQTWSGGLQNYKASWIHSLTKFLTEKLANWLRRKETLRPERGMWHSQHGQVTLGLPCHWTCIPPMSEQTSLSLVENPVVTSPRTEALQGVLILFQTHHSYALLLLHQWLRSSLNMPQGQERLRRK